MNKNYSAKHWCVLAGAFLILFAGLGLSANGLSLFNAVVATDMGYSQTAFTLFFLIGLLPQVIFGTAVGSLWSKNFERIRPMILIFGSLSGATLCLNAVCTQLWHFYAFALLRGVAGAFCAVLPASMLINRWFPQKRAFMTSIVMIGSSVGGLVFTQLCSFLLTQFNWRLAYVVLGLVDIALFLVATALISPHAPQDVSVEIQAEGKPSGEQNGLMLSDALKTPMMWLMLTGFVVGGLASMGFQGCFATALQLDYGYSVAKAGACYSVFVAVAIFGKLLMGWIFDRFGAIKGLMYQCVMLVLSLVSILLAQKQMSFSILLAIFFGLGNMIGTVTSTTIPPAIFGLKDYSKIYGFLTMFLTAAMGLGTTLSSAIYDLSGSYRPAWILYIFFNILCTAVFIIAIRMAKKRGTGE